MPTYDVESVPNAPAPVIHADREIKRVHHSAVEAKRTYVTEDGTLMPVGGRPLGSRVPEVVRDAMYKDIAIRLLRNDSVREIAAVHGLSNPVIRAILKDPSFGVVYEQARDDLYGRITEHITDEKAAPTLRRAAIQSRTMTLLGEIYESVREHIAAGKAGAVVKASMVRAGVDAVRAGIEMSRDHVPGVAHAGGMTLHVAPNVSVVMRAALGESGVDLSDVFDAEFEPVEDTPKESAPCS